MRCKFCKSYKVKPHPTMLLGDCSCLHITVEPGFGCELYQPVERETLSDGIYAMHYDGVEDLGRVYKFVEVNAPPGDLELFRLAVPMLARAQLYSFSVYGSESILTYSGKLELLKLRILGKNLKDEGESDGS